MRVVKHIFVGFLSFGLGFFLTTMVLGSRMTREPLQRNLFIVLFLPSLLWVGSYLALFTASKVRKVEIPTGYLISCGIGYAVVVVIGVALAVFAKAFEGL